jgi:hypothetical protein
VSDSALLAMTVPRFVLNSTVRPETESKGEADVIGQTMV